MVVKAEQLAVSFNDHLDLRALDRTGAAKGKPMQPKPIDLEAVRQQVEPAAQAHARLLVDIAQIEVCDMMGEHRRARSILDRHLQDQEPSG
jgi:hypothetical protein